MSGDVTVIGIVIVRWCEGKRKPIPCFGGCRGPEVTRTIKEIEHTFSKHLAGNETPSIPVPHKTTQIHEHYVHITQLYIDICICIYVEKLLLCM